jgi:hypothetical protein
MLCGKNRSRRETGYESQHNQVLAPTFEDVGVPILL